MKLSTVLNHINSALNYPNLTLDDIKLYFDQAFMELNTNLHISIPTLEDQINIFKHNLSNISTTEVFLNQDPAILGYNIPSEPQGNSNIYYFEGRFYKRNSITSTTWSVTQPPIVGIYVREGIPEKYQACVIGDYTAYWAKLEDVSEENYDLNMCLPDEWVLLWLIPYICFKYTIRDGGTATTFAEELTQGFQALQDTYDIPFKVNLASVADLPVYRSQVLDNISNLNISIPTKCITETMKHAREVTAIYGSVYDRGGF